MQHNTKQTLKIYYQHSKKHKFLFFLTFVGCAVAPFLDAVTPLYLKKFFDILSLEGDKSIIAGSLIQVLMFILILRGAAWLFWRMDGYSSAAFESKTMADISNTCFAYLHRHSFAYFNNTFVGSLVKKVNRFSRAFEGVIDRIIFNFLPLAVEMSFILTVLFIKNVFLGVAILLWLIVFLSINYFLAVYKLKYDLARSKAETEESGDLADTITNHANVKLFNGYKREVKNYSNLTGNTRKRRHFTWNLETTFEAVQTLLMIALEIGALYYAILLWKDGRFTLGDFVLLQTYLLMIMRKIWDFGRMIRHMYQDLSDAEEMTEILLTPHEITDHPKAKKLKVKEGEIKFEDVSFYYHDTRQIFKDFNLVIKPKEKVALVGSSGAGKSTIIKLILRMHDTDKGEILIDGQPIKKITQESLWKNISLVPQDPILFHRSLMENIRYGKPNASDAEVLRASKLARCHDFIKDFPEGYDTKVGERGVKLSGGERQRVAIARAILRDAPILLLDEATSSLDSCSEKLIQEALDNLMKNKTVAVVAHRLSTIMKSDRILVVEGGKIVEEGGHHELLNKKAGVYQKLWNIQAGEFAA